MGDIASIRDALKARLDTVAGLNAYDTNPTDVQVPAAFVYPTPGEFLVYDKTFEGAYELQMLVVVLVSSAVDEAAQDALDDYLVPGSSTIKAALEADQRLGGLVDWVVVTGAQNYGLHEVAGVPYFGAEMIVSLAVSP